MKKLIVTLLFAFLTIAVMARIRTVSNLDSAAQYSSIQAACDASASGDSIYVSDSPNPYEKFTINNKKLAVFGPGWRPFAFPGTANVPGCDLTGTAASGSELHGLTFTSTINIKTAGLNNVSFIRNKLGTVIFSAGVSGYLFEGNWFVLGDQHTNLSSSNAFSQANFIIRNNIFYNVQSYPYYPNIYEFKGVNIFFTNNLWYGAATARAPSQCFYNCSNLILSNNVFVRRNINGTSFSLFNNNITFNCENDAPWTINNNNDGGGNIAGQDPQLAAQASVNNGIDDPLLDFTIAGGPGNNTGSNGKDMGLIYDNGGSLNWVRSRSARLPYISKLNITNQSIFKNGKIYFTVEAKSN